MVEPQSAALIVSVGLTDPHLVNRQAREMHHVVQAVPRLPGMFRVVDPDIPRLPVVERIDVEEVVLDLRREALSRERVLGA